jgi:hypothetical protein
VTRIRQITFCVVCHEYIYGETQTPWCDEACHVRWLVRIGVLSQDEAMGYVRRRLMGIDVPLLKE